MLPISYLLDVYRARLRTQWRQELLAGLGIAAGVALVLAVQVANTSITASAREIIRGIAGDAQLQVRARGPGGVSDRIVERVRALEGVRVAAPVLEQRATLSIDGRLVPLDLVGVDSRLGQLGGAAGAPGMTALLGLRGVLVSEGAIGGPRAPLEATVATRGRALRTPVSGVLRRTEVGAVATGALAAAQLDRVEDLTGLYDRVTRVLVRTEPGWESRVRARLERIAGPELMVADTDQELRLLARATGPNDQATTMFAAIAAIVGLLLAGTAMLLTVPARRRTIAQLRLHGHSRWQVVQVAGFQAIVLGLVASAVGIGAGIALAHSSAQDPPGYLALAFPIGSVRTVSADMIAGALVGGMLVALLAAAQPLLDLRRGRPLDSAYHAATSGRERPGGRRRVWLLAVAAVAAIAAAIALVLLAPAAGPAAIGLLVVATLLGLPAVLAGVLAVAGLLDRIDRPSMVPLAVPAVRSRATRSLALAATCAIAVCGSVAIVGARTDLLGGLYDDYAEYVGTADVWVSQPGDDLATQPFAIPGRSLRDVPGIERTRDYYGSMLDVGDRRVWVIGRPPADRELIPASQITAGEPVAATARLRAGGTAAVAEQFAAARGVGLGDDLTLPTPAGTRRFEVVALTTNLGWGPGAVVLNARDYREAWRTQTPSAIEVDVAPGATPAGVAAAINARLATTGLAAQTSGDRSEHASGIARAGLARLWQIALLLLGAAAVAIAAAMASTLAERRPLLHQHAIYGWSRGAIASRLAVETLLILLAGCIAGAITGMVGHWMLGYWLRETTGFPGAWSPSFHLVVGISAAVCAIALLIVAVPGYRVTRRPTVPAMGHE